VGHGGASRALDRGLEAVWAVDDGEHRLRRRFGEELRSRKGMAGEIERACG
jgi:hypothetical protein